MIKKKLIFGALKAKIKNKKYIVRNQFDIYIFLCCSAVNK